MISPSATACWRRISVIELGRSSSRGDGVGVDWTRSLGPQVQVIHLMLFTSLIDVFE